MSDAERSRVADAVRQQDPDVVVHAVRRGPDGTFHVLGALTGEPVLAEVSKNFGRVRMHQRPVA